MYSDEENSSSSDEVLLDKKRRKKITKEEMIYGIFYEKPLEEDEENLETNFGKLNSAPGFVKSKNILFKSKGSDESSKPQIQVFKSKNEDVKTEGKITEKKSKKRKIIEEVEGADSDENKKITKKEKKKIEDGFTKTYGMGLKLLSSLGFDTNEKQKVDLEPLKVKVRPKRNGLDFNGIDHREENDDQETIEMEKEVKHELWKKTQEAIMKKKELRQKQEMEFRLYKENLNKASSSLPMKIIDMTGSEVTIINEISQCFSDKVEQTKTTPLSWMKRYLKYFSEGAKFSLQQLIINVDKANNEITNIEYQIEQIKESIPEKEKGFFKLEKIKIDYIINNLKQSIERYDETLNVEEFIKNIYEIYKLDSLVFFDNEIEYLVLSKLEEKIKTLLSKEWKINNDSEFYFKEIELIKQFFEVISQESNKYHDEFTEENLLNKKSLNESSKLFCHLIENSWYPILYSYITTLWDTNDHSNLFELICIWREIIPNYIMNSILNKIIFNRLQWAIDEWNPCADKNFVFEWISPWENLINLEEIYQMIKQKYIEALQNWIPTDKSAFYLIQKISKYLSQGHIEEILARGIIPKLNYHINSVIINPKNQKFEVLNSVLKWYNIIENGKLAKMLAKNVMPKWISVLDEWVSQLFKADSEKKLKIKEEITNWYLSWKKYFPSDIYECSCIKKFFAEALEKLQSVSQK